MITFSFKPIALVVKDVDESVEFCQKLFHLEEIDNTAAQSKTRWLSLNEAKQEMSSFSIFEFFKSSI